MNEEELPSYILTLSASDGEPLTLLVEPVWGQFELQPGEVFRVRISGPDEESIEIEHGRGYVSLWPGAKTSVAILDEQGEIVQVLD